MLCSVCRRCGLCEGDGSFSADKNIIVSSQGILDFSLPPDDTARGTDVGAVFDIGTTTLAARIYRLCTAELIGESRAVNPQVKFGADIVSRISYASERHWPEEPHSCLAEKLSAMLAELYSQAASYFLSRRMGRPVMSRIVIAGNTAMQSLALGLDVSGLRQFPFRPASLFGESVDFNSVFSGCPSFLECPVYASPAVSAFIGGDAVCAMLACGLADDTADTEPLFLADLGTSCEMAVRIPGSGRILCASSAAGPAFEGFGISCGMPACEGAVADFYFDGNNNPVRRVLGGGEARGLCGTGLLNVIHALYESGAIDFRGTMTYGGDGFAVAPKVRLSQKDVRNFQLAKGAVYAGLTVLLKEGSVTGGKLFLSGGFGTKLDVPKAVALRMIPSVFRDSVVHAGNAALSGAALLLLDEDARSRAERMSRKAECIDLAQYAGFESIFMDSIDFK
ncbi:MAG: DUF4445 domain-containing protein [Treponema sp.]|nr:DUF4445 domain-containing protein [Treponema sp.]